MPVPPRPSPESPPATDDTRQRNAERTQAEILEVATVEFAHRGFAGARVDEIAARTSTTKRMIYYYFGGKEQLYLAVLERAFEAIRPRPAPAGELSPEPLTMVREVAARAFEQFRRNPDMVRLMVIENVHGARYLADSIGARPTPDFGLAQLEAALAAGAEQGTIRAGVSPGDILMIVNSFCSYRIANRYTYQHLTGLDLLDPQAVENQRQMLDDLLVGYLTT